MNLYERDGVIADAAHGKHVIVVSTRREQAFRTVADVLDHDTRVSRITRSNGAQDVRFLNGGRINFVSSANALRGYSADVVLISRDAESHEVMENAILAINASPTGVVIR